MSYIRLQYIKNNEVSYSTTCFCFFGIPEEMKDRLSKLMLNNLQIKVTKTEIEWISKLAKAAFNMDLPIEKRFIKTFSGICNWAIKTIDAKENEFQGGYWTMSFEKKGTEIDE